MKVVYTLILSTATIFSCTESSKRAKSKGLSEEDVDILVRNWDAGVRTFGEDLGPYAHVPPSPPAYLHQHHQPIPAHGSSKRSRKKRLSKKDVDMLVRNWDAGVRTFGDDLGPLAQVPPSPPAYLHQHHQAVPGHGSSSQFDNHPHDTHFNSYTSYYASGGHHHQGVAHPPALDPAYGMAHHPSVHSAPAHVSASAGSSHHVRPPRPPGPPPYSVVLNIKVADFPIHRIYPIRNNSRELKLVVYDFRPKKQLFCRHGVYNFDYEPTGSQIMLVQENGDGLAIVHRRKKGPILFRSLFTEDPYPKGTRSKVNVNNNEVSPVTDDEDADVPRSGVVDGVYTIKGVGFEYKPRKKIMRLVDQ